MEIRRDAVYGLVHLAEGGHSALPAGAAAVELLR